jgi:hypothetical protein
MSFDIGLTTQRILEVFSDEIATRGGKVTDKSINERQLFARSIVAFTENVKPGDRLHGGVALKARQGEVCINPYVLRKVCTNGAVMSQALESTRLTHLDWGDPNEALDKIREAVNQCCAEEEFQVSVEQMRIAIDAPADLSFIASSITELLGDQSELMLRIFERLASGTPPSAFELMQDVTSFARDLKDPVLRWDLEELGGAIAATCSQSSPMIPIGEAVLARR